MADEYDLEPFYPLPGWAMVFLKKSMMFQLLCEEDPEEVMG